jgi:hypothetical protein
MRARWWWLRLQLWQWINAWRVQPVRSTLSPLCWVLVAIAVPASISMAGAVQSRAALEWVLSMDIPLALLLAIQVGSTTVARASRGNAESWISPRSRQGACGRIVRTVRWLHVLRWSLGLAIAALLLARGDARSTQNLIELLLLLLLGVTCGVLFAWNLIVRQRPAKEPARRGIAGVHGLSMLSRVPFQQAARQLDARRVVLLMAPVMLAAPMGSLVQQVAGAMAVWVLLLYVSAWMREARHTVSALARWMPRSGLAPMRLYWLVWRYVILATLLAAAALLAGWRAVSPGFSRVPS